MNRTNQLKLLAVSAVLLGAGCESEAGCPELCAKEVQCRQDSGVMGPDEETCVSQCETLSADDPAYAEAVEERASCIQDATCEEVLFGFGCTVEGD
jgi:hypothetical protein